LNHLLSTTGIPLVAIDASCDPASMELTATADCHAKAALMASLVGIEHCP
jgi:hypothetical protein